MNTFGENVTRDPNRASRRAAAAAISSARGARRRSRNPDVDRMRATLVVMREKSEVADARNDDHGDGSGELGSQLDELFGAPAEEFVATRARLVRELRASGRREDAKLLAARRRPTQTAGALNRLARAHAESLQEFFALAEPLSAAQVGGRAGDAEARERLRTLDDERRRRTEQLTDAAVALAGPSGAQHREEIGRTLSAALADPEIARTLAAGHLERVPDTAAGFDALAAAFEAAPAPVARPERVRASKIKSGNEENVEAPRLEPSHQTGADERA